MRTPNLLAASLLAALLAPIGCAVPSGEESAEGEASTEQSTQALTLPTVKPPPVPTPDFSGVTLAFERATALGLNGIAQSDGYTRLVLAPLNEKAVVFRALNAAVTTVANGFEVKGALILDTPSGPLSFGTADVSFQWGPDRSIGLAAVNGTVDLPFPAAGALTGITVSSIARGSIGYDLGSNLTALEAPLAADRHYLYVDVQKGFSANAAIVTFTAPGGKNMRAVVDPTDPSVYFKGNVLGLDKLGPVEDLAVGVSATGQIPFKPNVTWGIEDQVKNMKGHLYVAGSVPLSRYPLTIDGEIVVNVDPDNSGTSAFSNASNAVSIAANGTVNVTVDYVPTLSFSFPVVNATMGGKATNSVQYAYFSGEANSDVKWIPTVIPLRPAGSAKVAGLIHSDVSKSFLKAEGRYTLATTMVNDWLDLGLSDIDFATAKLQVDKNGFRLQGNASTPIHASLAPKGNVAVDAFFSGNTNNWYATMTGDFSIANFPLAAASATAAPTGLSVRGAFKTPISSVFMTGQITKAGPSLAGSTTVTIPIVAPKVVAQFIQSAQCGVRTVKSAAECGTAQGKNAAECGTTTAANAAECGVETLSKALCWTSGFDDCTKPKSCTFANSCKWAKSCEINNSCWVNGTDPAYNFGTVQGTVNVSVGPNGASASLAGKFCPVGGGACVATPSTNVTLGASPKACVSNVPGVSGQFCVNF